MQSPVICKVPRVAQTHNLKLSKTPGEVSELKFGREKESEPMIVSRPRLNLVLIRLFLRSFPSVSPVLFQSFAKNKFRYV